jgi:hypothetical protein
MYILTKLRYYKLGEQNTKLRKIKYKKNYIQKNPLARRSDIMLL